MNRVREDLTIDKTRDGPASRVSITVSPAGHVETFRWRGVPGATAVRVSSASLVIVPYTGGSGRNLGLAATGRSRVTHVDVTSPEPGTRIRSIRIPNLKLHVGATETEIRSESNLGGHRLVVAPFVGGKLQAPIVAVPALGGKKALPAQLTGGALSGSVLNLPDIVGDRFRITLVKGSAPEDFDSQQMSFGDITMKAAPEPVGLYVEGPDGAQLFALAGPIRSPVEVDLKAALGRHFDASLDDLELEGAFTVRSDIQGSAGVSLSATGVVERKVDERLQVDTEGAPEVITVAGRPPERAPRATTADLTVTHHGMALHPISDALPQKDADLGGPVVREKAVIRAFPPESLAGQRVRKVGAVGWALSECDVRMEVLDHGATVEGVEALAKRSRPSVVWFDFGEGFVVNRNLEVALTATRGAFGWIANPEPLVRFAVAASPEGERVTVGGVPVDLTSEETLVTAARPAGSGAYAVTTDQFCTVSLSNLTLEFAP